MKLAETLGAPVYDVGSRLNFPSRHPLNFSMVKDVFRDADVVLSLDTRDWERPTTELVSTTRKVTSLVPDGLQVDRHRLRRPGDLELGDGLPAPLPRRRAGHGRYDPGHSRLDRSV